jgi:hypothetical protein
MPFRVGGDWRILLLRRLLILLGMFMRFSPPGGKGVDVGVCDILLF